MKTLFRKLLFVVALGLAPFAAQAGSSANSKSGIEVYGDAAIRSFTEKVNATLDAKQVNLAIIARSGRPRSQLPDGISYTHVAFIVFEAVKAPNGHVGHTYTVYNLYQGADGRKDRSYLAQDFTYDFLAGTHEKDVGVIIPTDDLQKKILGVIRSPTYRALHNPNYNLVCNPWQHKFDNCVTHSLRVIFAAIYETSDDARIQNNIRRYFKPTPVRLGLLKDLGSNLIQGVSHEDKDPSGLQTASFDSLKVFFEENQLAKESLTIQMD